MAKQLDAQTRRELLIEATIKVMAEHGVAGATTRRIAAEAGFPLASLHYVFHTKDELFSSVYEKLWIISVTPDPLKDLPSPSQRAAMLLEMSMEWAMENPGLARVQAELFYWALRNSPALSASIYTSSTQKISNWFVKILSPELSEVQVAELVKIYAWLVDGLLASWFAHDYDVERLKADTAIACKVMVNRLFAFKGVEKI